MDRNESHWSLDGFVPEDHPETDALIREMSEIENVTRRDRLDREIGAAMRDVPVPEGMLDRVIDAVERSGNDATASFVEEGAAGCKQLSHDQAPPSRGGFSLSRRRWLIWGAGVSSVCAALVIIGLFLPQVWQSPLSLEQLYHEMPTAIGALPQFDGSFDPRRPTGWNSSAFDFHPQIGGAWPNLWDQHQVAIYEFSVTDGPRGQLEYGLLLVVPRSAISNDEIAADFRAARPDYVSPEGFNLQALAWEQDGMVYVCVVEAGGSALHAIEAGMRGPSA